MPPPWPSAYAGPVGPASRPIGCPRVKNVDAGRASTTRSEPGSAPAAHRAADFLALTKPRLNSLVVVTAGIGYYLGAGRNVHVARPRRGGHRHCAGGRRRRGAESDLRARYRQPHVSHAHAAARCAARDDQRGYDVLAGARRDRPRRSSQPRQISLPRSSRC